MPEHQNVYIHGHHDSVLRSHRWRTVANSAAYLVPHLQSGQRVLDVGCGPGTITIDLARRVAPGSVIGIDNEPAPLEEARAQARRQDVHNVSFAVADVYELDIPWALSVNSTTPTFRSPETSVVSSSRRAAPASTQTVVLESTQPPSQLTRD